MRYTLALIGMLFSATAQAQYLTPAVNSPLFPSTPSAGMVPIASNGSTADWGTLSSGNLTYLAPFTGSISETQNVYNSQRVSVVDFGAKCDGVTDDTAAIQAATAAISASIPGGTLMLPVGSCLINGSGSAILTITTPISIVGAGNSPEVGGSILLVATSVPTSRDIIHVVGVTDQTRSGYRFSDFAIASQGAVGKHAIHFDSTAGTTTNFRNVVIDNVFIEDLVSAGGFSIFLDNGIGTNINGGMFTFTVSNSYLGGGLSSSQTGDTINVIHTLIHTANAGVTIDQVAGAGNFLVSNGSNISGQAGCVVVTQAVSPIIQDSECEQQATNTEANNAVIDLIGSGGNISAPKIINMQIQSNVGVGNPTPIRVAAATTAYIDGNRIAPATSQPGIVVTAAAEDTRIGCGNKFVGVSAYYSDASGTILQCIVTGFPTVADGIYYHSGLNQITTTAAMTDGQLLVGQTGAAPLPKSITGDASISAAGAVVNKSLSASTATSLTLTADIATLLGDANTGPTLALKPSSGGGAVGVSGVNLFNYGAGASNQNAMFSYNARGTVASPTAVQSGDPLFLFGIAGHDGTNIAGTNGFDAGINALAAGTFTTSSHPTNLIFYTTPSGTKVVANAMQINASGGVGIGTTTDPLIGVLLANKGTQVVPTVVGSLPTCNSAAKGLRSFVTDELAAVAFNTVATGGGANNVPVFCDGTAWRIG